MYLLYADESGNSDGDQDKYFVLGGIAMHEQRPYWLNDEVNQLESSFFKGGEKVEFHAQAISAHAEEPWHSLDGKARTAILEGLCRIVAGTREKVVLFGVAVEKALYENPAERAFEELANRFDLFLRRLHAQGDTHRGLIIFDESRYEWTIQQLLSAYRDSGTRWGKIKSFADVPFFADSKSTRLLQLADLVAYSIFRRYERSNTWLLDKLIGKFDVEDGVIHGLVHLARDRQTCTCPACLSRRLNQKPEE
jgi:hypothetical protein